MPLTQGPKQLIVSQVDLAKCLYRRFSHFVVVVDCLNFCSTVRLFNQGLDIVEVSDDGSGVPMESRHFMAMKHATSKIRNFDEIYSTDSLGFRGEALFCLANISGGLVVAT